LRHPELRALHGHEWRTVAVGALAVAVQLGLAAALSHAPFLAKLAVAATVGAGLTHLCACVFHEATHNLCARGTLSNRLVALAMNVPLPLPIVMSFRRLHLQHHLWFGTGDDPDLPSPLGLRMLAGPPLVRVLWLFVFPMLGLFSRRRVERPGPWELAGFLFQLGVNAAIVLWLGSGALAYLALCVPFQFGTHPSAWHFLGEHAWGKTTSYYGALNRLTVNVGHHNEHHDFPGIPGPRLARVRRIGGYDALPHHDGALGVLRAFLFSAAPPE
jgi:sphingolipid delta-4 desaturase